MKISEAKTQAIVKQLHGVLLKICILYTQTSTQNPLAMKITAVVTQQFDPKFHMWSALF